MYSNMYLLDCFATISRLAGRAVGGWVAKLVV